MVRRLLWGLALVGLCCSCSLSQRIAKADKKMALGEYYRAADMYKAVYPSISSTKKRAIKASVAAKMGHAYRIVENNRKAEQAYKNAVRYGSKDSLLYYYYGEVLRENGKYAEALKMYTQFQKLCPESHLADSAMVSCTLASNKNHPKSRYEVKKDTRFNSRASDFCPAFASMDGDVLYFNSTRVQRGAKKTKTSQITGMRNNDIYMSRANMQGKWDEPSLVEGDINTEFDEGTCCFSADGQELFFTRSKVVKGETLAAAIYSCKRSGAAWSEAQKVKILADSSITCAHPALSPDGEYLYFVSDMPGGYGGTDIWRARRGGEGFDQPENLGPSINTEGQEMFPSFDASGALYFSSDGREGLGGLDMYVATYAGDWQVSHLPEPLNSRWDDFGITLTAKGNEGYFSSNRNDTKGYDKIYHFLLPELEYTLSGVVTDSKGEALGNAVVRLVSDAGDIIKIQTKKNGSYQQALRAKTRYVLLATCRGFLNSKQTVEVPDVEQNQQFVADFQLTSVSKPVKMNNIFFKFGSAELTEESSAGLDDLVRLLQDNPNITIEIGAHTDYVGAEETNRVLSQQRAQAVVSYLSLHGVEKERLTAKGYGENQPVVPDRSLVRKYRFLKVDVPLTEEFIQKLSSEQQEIANQINRRTEFKVLKTTYKMF